MKPRKLAADVPPIAISYVRFSTPEQRKGDSLRRQTEGTQAWCQKNGIALDESLSCRDAGRSAFHGRHRSDKAALGRFLELVKEGRVPRGSFLVIENLDRLSREDERTALRLWLDILDAGINIVQLHPETIFRHERSDMVDIIRAIIELSRGHSESRMKAVRSAKHWENAVRGARDNGRVMTSRLPAWLRRDGERVAVIPERAAVVRRIFAMVKAGYGASSIVKRLNREKVPAFGGRVPDDEGHYRKVEGDHLGSGLWRRAYVRLIIRDRRVLGELQPRNADGERQGGPIAGYYPAVIDEGEWLSARAAISGRSPQRGRIGEGVASLFSGLLKDARDGSTYTVVTRSEADGSRRCLLNRSSIESDARAYTFDYSTFEEAILSILPDIDPAKIETPIPEGVMPALQGELSWIRERRSALALALLSGDVPEITDALRDLKTREDEIVAQIDDNADLIAVPRIDTWSQAKSLAGLLKDAEDPEDVRLRLRAAIRLLVEEVRVLVIPRGRHRLCAVQMYFSRSNKTRNYLIYHQAAWAGRNGRKPSQWWARSLANDDGGILDLRQQKHALALAAKLQTLHLDEFVRGCERKC